jgi:uncharacterized membrane protein
VPRSREAALISALVAVGAASRIGLGRLALGLPTPAYGLLVKVGLTETLAFVSGFLFGPAMGFLSGAMIIVISDLFMMPGVWTPFIAAIIGIFGLGGSAVRRLGSEPSVLASSVFAVAFTVLSEFLQNAWFAWFFNIPITAVFLMGVPSAVTAIVNNAVLIPTLGRKVIRLIQNTIPGRPGGANARQVEGSKGAQGVGC